MEDEFITLKTKNIDIITHNHKRILKIVGYNNLSVEKTKNILTNMIN